MARALQVRRVVRPFITLLVVLFFSPSSATRAEKRYARPIRTLVGLMQGRVMRPVIEARRMRLPATEERAQLVANARLRLPDTAEGRAVLMNVRQGDPRHAALTYFDAHPTVALVAVSRENTIVVFAREGATVTETGCPVAAARSFGLPAMALIRNLDRLPEHARRSVAAAAADVTGAREVAGDRLPTVSRSELLASAGEVPRRFEETFVGNKRIVVTRSADVFEGRLHRLSEFAAAIDSRAEGAQDALADAAFRAAARTDTLVIRDPQGTQLHRRGGASVRLTLQRRGTTIRVVESVPEGGRGSRAEGVRRGIATLFPAAERVDVNGVSVPAQHLRPTER